MNIKCVSRCFSAVVLSCVLLVGAGCSKVESSLLDSVPAKSQVIGVMDVELLLKRAGCQVNDGAIQLSPELQRAVDVPSSRSNEVSSIFGLMTDLYGAIDLSEVVYVASEATSSGDTYMTFIIADQEALANKMEALGAEKVSGEDFECYSGDTWTLAVRDAQGWLLPEGTDVSKAGGIIARIDRKESIASESGIVDFLNTDNAVNMAVLSDGLSGNEDQPGRRVCTGIKVEDSVIGARMQLIAPDGAVTDFASGYQEADTRFLSYVPGSYIAAAAVGFTPDFDWSAIGTAAAMLGNRDISSAVQMAIPFLSKIDGTVAVAAGPAGGAPAIAKVNLSTWNFLVMAHMKQADVDAILSQIGMLAGQLGAKPVKGETMGANVNAYELPDGTVVYAGNVDGYLALSNREFDADGENSMTDTFLSQRAAMAVNIPAGSEVVKAFDLPWGFNCSVQVEESEVNVRFSLNGTDQSVMQALLAQMVK